MNSESRKQYDVIVIGAGVVGNAIARELSRYKINVAVMEKEMDVGMGTSSRNSGVIHSGINYKPGTWRAKMDVLGNSMMEKLCNELKVKIDYIGKLTVAQEEEDKQTIYDLKTQGEANGVPGLEILSAEQMQKKQPGVGGLEALYSPSTGIISPYGLTISLAENALQNGVHYYLNSEVIAITKQAEGFTVQIKNGESFDTKIVINAAGLYSDQIAKLVGLNEFKIYPCRGEYYILDKRLQGTLSILVYPAPHKGKAGLGIHLTNTVDGNILIGPSDEYIEQKDDVACTADIMKKLQEEGHELLPGLLTSDFIRSFSGLRAKQNPPEIGGFKDFVIESRKDVPGFINLVGLESPGLTSSPAIAITVRDMVKELIPLPENNGFIANRKGEAMHFYEKSPEEKADLIAKDPNYGEIVCRCEQITKKEVLDAIQNPLHAKTLVGIKYRARAMMGRCQGGFCTPRIVRILEDEFGYKPKDYLLKSSNSPLFVGYMREGGDK